MRLWRSIGLALLWSGSAAAQQPGPSPVDSSLPSPEPKALPSDPPNVELEEELITRGIELRKTGDDRGALSAFTRAFTTSGSARARAQMALAEQALGRWVDAYHHLREALRRRSDPWIVEHEATLVAALAQIEAELGTLEVSCNVPGAAIYIDGRLVGRAPMSEPVKLVAGQSVLRVVAPNHFELVRRVQVDAGKLSRAEVTLTSSAAESSARPGDPSGGGETTSRDWLMYGSIGLAGVGVTAGVTGWVIREVNLKIYNDDSRCRQDPEVSRSTACPEESAAWRRGEVIAIVGFSTAAVFGALGLYLWLDRPKNAASTGLACGAGFAGAACAGTF